MAVNINLLPPEIKLQWVLKEKQQKLVVVGSLTGIFLLVLFGFLLVATIHAKADAVKLAKEKEVLLNKFPELEQYAAIQDQVSDEEKILEQAMGAPPEWVNLLYDLGRCMPADVWLTDFTASYQQETEKQAEKPKETKPADDKAVVTKDQLRNVLGMQPKRTEETLLDGGVTISGYADDQLSVAELLNNIQQVAGLTGAKCQTLSQEEVDGKIVIHFKITAELLSGSPNKP